MELEKITSPKFLDDDSRYAPKFISDVNLAYTTACTTGVSYDSVLCLVLVPRDSRGNGMALAGDDAM